MKKQMKIAIRASLTGHLVMTTLHTNDARGAILRFMDFGITRQEIEQSLLAIAAQMTCRIKVSVLQKKVLNFMQINEASKASEYL